MNKSILIRADASAEIGTGHVMRCLALAQAWRDQGGRAVFAMAESTPAVRARIEAESFNILETSAVVGSRDDWEWLCGLDQEASWLVLDGYRFDEGYQRAVRKRAWRILCIDDEGRLAGCTADLLVNQNLHASASIYRGTSAGRLLLGPRYALLRKEFLQWQDWQRSSPQVATSLLISLGGGVQMKAARTVLASLERIEMPDAAITFVVGGSGPGYDELEQGAKLASVIFVRNPSNMPELMANAHLAVSAAGTTCWELCFLGVPSLLIDVASNQTPIAQALQGRDYAIHVGSVHELTVEELTRQLRELMLSQQRRELLSQHCRTLVDGHGAERVAAAMNDLAGRTPLSCDLVARA